MNTKTVLSCDFNHSDFRPNSPQETYFFVCYTSAAKRPLSTFFVARLQWFEHFFLASSFASIYLPRSARPIVRPNSIFALKQNVAVAHTPLISFAKSCCGPHAVNILFCTFSELFRNVPVAHTPLRIPSSR